MFFRLNWGLKMKSKKNVKKYLAFIEQDEEDIEDTDFQKGLDILKSHKLIKRKDKRTVLVSQEFCKLFLDCREEKRTNAASQLKDNLFLNNSKVRPHIEKLQDFGKEGETFIAAGLFASCMMEKKDMLGKENGSCVYWTIMVILVKLLDWKYTGEHYD